MELCRNGHNDTVGICDLSHTMQNHIQDKHPDNVTERDRTLANVPKV
jgi:hypothetical protein